MIIESENINLEFKYSIGKSPHTLNSKRKDYILEIGIF